MEEIRLDYANKIMEHFGQDAWEVVVGSSIMKTMENSEIIRRLSKFWGVSECYLISSVPITERDFEIEMSMSERIKQ